MEYIALLLLANQIREIFRVYNKMYKRYTVKTRLPRKHFLMSVKLAEHKKH